MSFTFVMNTAPKTRLCFVKLLFLITIAAILVNVAIGTELICPALSLGGEGVAAVHVEGGGQEAEARDVAGGALDVDVAVDVIIPQLTRVTLQIP